MRDRHRMRAGSRVQLAQDRGDVVIDRLRRDEQLASELCVRVTFREQTQYLQLAIREPERIRLRALAPTLRRRTCSFEPRLQCHRAELLDRRLRTRERILIAVE